MSNNRACLVLLLTVGCGAPSAIEDDANAEGSGAITATCSVYLDCLADWSASDLGDALAAFGEGGTCWTEGGDNAELCDRACDDGLREAWEFNWFGIGEVPPDACFATATPDDVFDNLLGLCPPLAWAGTPEHADHRDCLADAVVACDLAAGVACIGTDGTDGTTSPDPAFTPTSYSVEAQELLEDSCDVFGPLGGWDAFIAMAGTTVWELVETSTGLTLHVDDLADLGCDLKGDELVCDMSDPTGALTIEAMWTGFGFDATLTLQDGGCITAYTLTGEPLN